MKKIIIIGAGPAGLTAAYQLLRNDPTCHPVILEASPYIGGISRTHVAGSNRMDLGGHRFFTKSDRVMDLWTEIMPLQGAPAKDDLLLDRAPELVPGGPNPEETDAVMLRRRRISRIYFLNKFFDYPIAVKPQTFINMGLARTLSAGFGYIAATVHKRPENSLEDFYINHFGKPLYQMFFENYTQKVWGVHPSQIAPDWGSQRVKGLSLFKAVLTACAKPFRKKKEVETSLIEEYYYPKKGPGSLYETLAEKITAMGGEIRLNTTVTGLETNGERITAIRTRADGQESSEPVDVVFSSMAVKDLVGAMDPAAPADIQKIAWGLPYRDFITVGLLVNKLAIPNRSGIPTVGDIVPDCWIYIQDRGVQLGRLQIFNNWSPYMVEDLQNTVFLGLEYFCTEGDALWTRPDADFIRMATDELCQIGIIDPGAVLESTIVHVKKAYPAYFGTYSEFDTLRHWLGRFDNLYCIGRNGQHRYNNMDHSILTAMTAADVYAHPHQSKDRIWEVNTDDDYHESK